MSEPVRFVPEMVIVSPKYASPVLILEMVGPLEAYTRSGTRLLVPFSFCTARLYEPAACEAGMVKESVDPSLEDVVATAVELRRMVLGDVVEKSLPVMLTVVPTTASAVSIDEIVVSANAAKGAPIPKRKEMIRKTPKD